MKTRGQKTRRRNETTFGGARTRAARAEKVASGGHDQAKPASEAGSPTPAPKTGARKKKPKTE